MCMDLSGYWYKNKAANLLRQNLTPALLLFSLCFHWRQKRRVINVFCLPICNSQLFVYAGVSIYSPHWFHMWQGGKKTVENGSRDDAHKQEIKIKDTMFLKYQVRNSGDSV